MSDLRCLTSDEKNSTFSYLFLEVSLWINLYWFMYYKSSMFYAGSRYAVHNFYLIFISLLPDCPFNPRLNGIGILLLLVL